MIDNVFSNVHTSEEVKTHDHIRDLAKSPKHLNVGLYRLQRNREEHCNQILYVVSCAARQYGCDTDVTFQVVLLVGITLNISAYSEIRVLGL